MKNLLALLTLVTLAAVFCPATLLADSVELDLAIHEAAQKAKAAGRTNILIVVREDYKSEADTNVSKALDALQQTAVKDLAREKLQPVTNDAANTAARSTKARRSFRPTEMAQFREHAEFDAVLSLDFKALGNKMTVRVCMVDAAQVLSTDFIELANRPSLENQPAESKPMANTAPAAAPVGGAQPGPGPKDKKGPKGPVLDGPDPSTLPQPENGATAYMIEREGAGRLVRSTDRRIQGQGNSPRPGGPDAPGGKGQPVGEGGKPQGDGPKGDKPPGDKPLGEKPKGEGPGKAGPKPGEGKGDLPKKGGEGDGQGKPDGGEGKSEKDRSATEEAQAIRNTNLQIGEIGRGILGFASQQIGKQVGNGQCWTLAAEAMRAAGAEPPKGYTYGNQVEMKDVQPGDILQFKTARFDEPGYWAIMGSPDHTAVVQSVGSERIYILHQNFSGNKTVQTFDLNPNNLTAGKMEVWRPVPRGQDGFGFGGDGGGGGGGGFGGGGNGGNGGGGFGGGGKSGGGGGFGGGKAGGGGSGGGGNGGGGNGGGGNGCGDAAAQNGNGQFGDGQNGNGRIGDGQNGNARMAMGTANRIRVQIANHSAA